MVQIILLYKADDDPDVTKVPAYFPAILFP